MRWLLVAVLVWPAAGENRFSRLENELKHFPGTLHAAVIESGRVAWQRGKITAPAPEAPVIAERIPQDLLDTPVPTPLGATIRQVLANTADGTPGEEVLENRALIAALKPIGGSTPLPGAVEFAKRDHGDLGWFHQDYNGERLLWSYSDSVLLIRIPNQRLTLIVSGNLKPLAEAARLEDGNIARSTLALAFLGKNTRDDLIDRALVALYAGDKDKSAALAHQALDKFPELESTPDVTLLYLFAQLGLRETEASATAVIRAHPSLPTAWFYYGQYLEKNKRYREAAACYEKITMHEPPWHNWTVAAATEELKHLKTY